MNSKNYFTSIGFGALSLGANAKLATFKNTINESASIAKIITESKEFKF